MNIEPTRPTKHKTTRGSASPKVKGSPAPAIPATRASRPVSPCDDLQMVIAKRAYELFSERGYRHGYALDDWLEAEREILSQIPPI